MKRLGILVAVALVALAFPIPNAFAACHAFAFDQNSYSAGEGARHVTITVSRDGTVADSSIKYSTQNMSASAGQDYTAANSVALEYTGAQTEKQITIPITNDTRDEPNETFRIQLHDPAGCTGGGFSIDDPATVTITDNDPKPIIKRKPTPTPTPTQTRASPRPSPRSTMASPSPSRTPTASPSPTVSASPSPTATPIAAPDAASSEGISGGALAGIVGGVVVAGGAAAIVIRRRFLT